MTYRLNRLFPFFEGLIPEGWLLEIASTSWKINKNDRIAAFAAAYLGKRLLKKVTLRSIQLLVAVMLVLVSLFVAANSPQTMRGELIVHNAMLTTEPDTIHSNTSGSVGQDYSFTAIGF